MKSNFFSNSNVHHINKPWQLTCKWIRWLMDIILKEHIVYKWRPASSMYNWNVMRKTRLILRQVGASSSHLIRFSPVNYICYLSGFLRQFTWLQNIQFFFLFSNPYHSNHPVALKNLSTFALRSQELIKTTTNIQNLTRQLLWYVMLLNSSSKLHHWASSSPLIPSLTL